LNINNLLSFLQGSHSSSLFRIKEIKGERPTWGITEQPWNPELHITEMFFKFLVARVR
jgi:hypothetical protein